MKISATVLVFAVLGFGLCAFLDRAAFKDERSPVAIALLGLASFLTIPASVAALFLCAIWDIA